MAKFNIEIAFCIADKGRYPQIRHHDGIGGRVKIGRRYIKILGRYLTELNGHFVLRMNNRTREHKAAYD